MATTCFDKLLYKEIVGVKYDKSYLSLFTRDGRHNFKTDGAITNFECIEALKGSRVTHIVYIRTGVLIHTNNGVFKITTVGDDGLGTDFVPAKGRPKTGLYKLSGLENKHRITITITAEYDESFPAPDKGWLKANVNAAVGDGLLSDENVQVVSWSETIKEG